MKTYFSFIILFFILFISPQNIFADYCVRAGNSTYPYGRKLNSIQFTGDKGGTPLKITDLQKTGTDLVYWNRADYVFYAQAGDSITPMLDFSGAGMHAYIYIDYDGDETFSTALGVNDLPIDRSEFVSFTYYKGKNSSGKISSRDDAVIDKVTTPKFRLPIDLKPGNYRVRVKIDFDNISACGGYYLPAYGGSIVDFTLKITGSLPPRTITVSSSNPSSGSAVIVDSLGVESNTVSTTEAVKLQATAYDNYEFVNWSIGSKIIGNQNPMLFSQAIDANISANFRAKEIVENDYCIFPGNSTNPNNRKLNAIQFTTADAQSLTISDLQTTGNSPVYWNRTDRSLTAKPGDKISPVISWTGTYMHAYIYVDYNSDRVFSAEVDENGLPNSTSEVVSYSYFNGKNSLGTTVPNNQGVTTSNVPSFTLPADLADGNYRIRVKIDWNSLDPCGNPVQSIAANGGCIVDFTLRIGNIPEIKNYTVNIENPQKSDWKLNWADEFNEPELDSNSWSKIPRIIVGNAADWRVYISDHESCYEMRDGALVLKGIENKGVDPNDTRAYLTGGVFSNEKKTFMRGRIDIRAKYISATGAWPAIWMKPQEAKSWPTNGEIDIMEHLNYENIVYQTVHSLYTQNVSGSNPPKSKTTNINKDDWNVYSVEMQKDAVVFYVNNQKTITYPRNGAENQFPFDQPFYLLLDMQLGGSWVGSINPSTLPVEMAIDYVRFYKQDEPEGKIKVKKGGLNIENGQSVAENSDLTVYVEPAPGFVLDQLLINGVDVTDQYLNGKYEFQLTENVNISAIYKPHTFNINYSVIGDGKLNVTDSEGKVVQNGSTSQNGDTIKVEILAAENGQATKYWLNGLNRMQYLSENVDKIIVSEDINLDVVFESLTNLKNKGAVEYQILPLKNGFTIKTRLKSNVKIYSLNGMLLKNTVVDGSKNFTFPRGCYLVSINNEAQKVLF